MRSDTSAGIKASGEPQLGTGNIFAGSAVRDRHRLKYVVSFLQYQSIASVGCLVVSVMYFDVV